MIYISRSLVLLTTPLILKNNSFFISSLLLRIQERTELGFVWVSL